MSNVFHGAQLSPLLPRSSSGGFRGYVHFGQLCTSTKYCAPYVAMPKIRVEVGVMHGHIASVTLMHVNEFTFSHRPGINIFLFITLNHNLSVT